MMPKKANEEASMSAEHPIVVGVDASPGTDAALRWAIEDAGTRNVAVRLVCAYRWVLAYGRIPMYADIPKVDLVHFRHVAEQVLAKAIGRAAEIDPGVEVRAEAIDADPVPVLIEESSRAALIVLGSRQRTALGSSMLGSVSAGVAARAACPAVVVRGPAGLPEENPPVVVGVDGTEASEALLQFGFEHASRHHTPLRAVLCWHPDLLAWMMWRPEPPAPARAEVWLSEALAGWREKYPDVVVHGAVVRDHPAAGLVAESAAAHLLVVGSRGRHALAGTLLGSVSQGVLHHATCPVAVVPTHNH